ncbi:MAG: SAM-dependent methyltransferase [Mycobacterium sp.]|jgi:cyclopropane-fatty-acyl-phospholipid synthase|nr:SAM-dependent methyltransferase [Mycobacterium sp.]
MTQGQTENLRPNFVDVQTHYDLSDEFFRLFLDPTQTYSCAYFERDDMTLEEAQIAKIDLSLSKCDLKPGMTLLDIGCGWGATIMRAVERYDVNVVGLTLSENQFEHVQKKLAASDAIRGSGRHAEVRLQGWEEFSEPVDRIVSIGAFEHFKYSRHEEFFRRTFDILPADGRMMLHSIIGMGRDIWRMGRKITREDMEFFIFIAQEIFPGGELPQQHTIPAEAEKAGYTVEQVQSLQPHYARTLDLWAAALEARHDDAVRIASEETYQTYMRYLTGCADRFRWGHSEVTQYTLVKQP